MVDRTMGNQLAKSLAVTVGKVLHTEGSPPFFIYHTALGFLIL